MPIGTDGSECTVMAAKPNGDICVLSGLTLGNFTFWQLSVYCAVKTIFKYNLH